MRFAANEEYRPPLTVSVTYGLINARSGRMSVADQEGHGIREASHEQLKKKTAWHIGSRRRS